MKILFLTFFFPPYNSIGALRTGKTAKYLTKLGHDLRVISAADQNTVNASLPLEIERERVHYEQWINLRWPLDKLVGKGKSADLAGANGSGPTLAGRAAVLYRSLFYVPDLQGGWYPFAIRSADRIIAEWRPDVILCSASPVTSLVLAHRLAKRHGIPWIGDLRDLWVDNQDYQAPAWRKRLDEAMERRVMRSASGFVTVSEPLAETLRKKFGKPVNVVLNGFDASDYGRPCEASTNDGLLRIVFTGTIYAGRQTPEPLFHALHLLGDKAKRIRVDFYGSPRVPIVSAPHYSGLEEIVTVHAAVPHDRIVSIQKSADVLLHLLWNDPAQPGVYNAKVFEYFGARRPILAVGYTGNVTAALVRERAAGLALEDPAAIAETLNHWLDARQSGTLPSLPPEATRGLSREEQTGVLHEFMQQVVAGH